MRPHELSSISAKLLRLVDTGRTDTVIPVEIRIVGHPPVMQVLDASVGGCLRTAEIRILIDRDAGPANDLDRANLIIQPNLANIRSPLGAEIISGEVYVLEEASTTVGPVRRTV